MEEKIIGVVGGVGPFAGLDLCQKILEETIAETDQDYLTVINWSQSNRILDRTEFLIGNVSENPGYAMAEQIHRLGEAGASVAAIPCNTAHSPAIFNVIRVELERMQVQVKLLHMIEETAVFIQTNYPEIKRIGALSTTGTYRAKIYPECLQVAQLDVLVPDIGLQETQIHPAIYDLSYGIKATGIATNRARGDLLAGAKHLRQQGAEAIILGCTEIPLAIPEPTINNMIVIDPTRILARALIREADRSRLKQLH